MDQTDRDLSIRVSLLSLSADSGRILTVRAHEIRALAASLAKIANIPFDAVFRAARWKNHTTFINFCLRDLQKQVGGLFRLGLLVVAQHEISLQDSSKPPTSSQDFPSPGLLLIPSPLFFYLH